MPPAPNTGDLWMPHVYMPNQNKYDISGINAFGRWHYGPWFWPPTSNIVHGPVPNPYVGTAPWEGAEVPGTPNPSMAMEAFMDTQLVNGTAYPYMDVEPKAYRFRILNASNDRFVNLQMYVADPDVTTADGRTNTEVKMVPASATAGFPASWPKDGREGGVPDPARVGPDWIQIGTEGGFLPAPVVIPNQPIGWNLNATNFNFGNVNQHSLLIGTAERADVIVDFSAYPGQTIILYNDAPAAFPALDPRYDYYTGNPDQISSGGTPPTQAGFGPNTRTIMQFRVAGAAAGAYPLAALRAAFTKTPTKRGVFEVSQDPIIVPQASYNSAYNGSFPADPYVRIADGSKTFQTLDGVTVTIPFEPKAIQDEMGEAFDMEYGRMSGFLGVELPVGSGVQRFTLFPFISPPLEIAKDSMTPMSPVAGDGTQIWKITHNGVDTHTIHFHLFNVQLINHVAWDNAVRPPDANELGWKETVRVDPLEDTIVALRPIAPTQPFKVPNSVRPIDVLSPIGAVLPGGPGGFKNPAGDPVTIVNHEVNYGWEYVWHCHILGHEEMDMMHALSLAAIPEAPTNLTAVAVAGPPLAANLAWTDNSLDETAFTIQRATDAGFTAGLTAFSAPKDAVSYTDSTILDNQAYYFRVFATNVVGDIDTPGFPTKVADSAFSNTATLGQAPAAPNPPTNLVAQAISGTQVNLTWTAPLLAALKTAAIRTQAATITGFRIERSTDGGATWPFSFSIPDAAAVSYSDVTAQPLTSYAYRVFATSASGDSAPSNIATVTTPQAPPNAPSNLTARLSLNRARVILNWVDNSNNENGFYVQRRTTGGTYATIATVGAGVRTYDDAGVVGGTTYFYQVIAFRTNGGLSAPSNEVSIALPSLVPAAPANLRILRTYRRTITLAWQDLATNDRGVYIERSTDGVTFTRVRTITDPNITRADVQNLTPNTLYYFRVQYYNRYGASAYSNIISGTTLP
jgi:FtsP/CotA-like multicopper oxidase with cupredoxin domain